MKTESKESKKITGLRDKTKQGLVLTVALSTMLSVCWSCSEIKQRNDQTNQATEKTNIAERQEIESEETQYPNPEDWDGKSPLELSKTFSNSDFTINYPAEWVIDSQNETNDWNVTTVVSIGDPNLRENQYTPNLRVLTVPEKVDMSTRELAEGAWLQVQHEGYPVELVEIYDGYMNGLRYTMLEYVLEGEYGPKRIQQCMIKKPDNTSFSIVAHTNYDIIPEAYTVTAMMGTFQFK